MLIAGEAVHVVGGGGGLVARACPTLSTPWTVVCQGPLSMGFSRKECWSGLPFPSPGALPDPGIEPGSPALQADSLPTELWGKPHLWWRQGLTETLLPCAQFYLEQNFIKIYSLGGVKMAEE